MKRLTPLAAACAALLSLAACQDAPLAPRTTPALQPYIPTAPISHDVRTGWIYGPDGHPMEVTFNVHEGWAIYEGDINLGRADKVARTREELTRAGGPKYGVHIDGSTYRWPSGTVPYVIDASFNSTQESIIQSAVNHVNGTVGGVKLKQRTTETNYIVFGQHSTLCNSPVGRQSGTQTINLTSNCAYSMGSVAHEILHTLGMWHEQSRCDRDTYITVNLSNVASVNQHNFDKKCTNATDRFAYNEGSIMHYHPYDFAVNTSIPTITSKRGLDYLMGQRSGLAQSDVSTLNYIYRPYYPQNFTVTNSSGNALASWSASPGATHYTITYIERFEYHDNWGSGSYSQEYVGSPNAVYSNSSVIGTYGNTMCVTYDDMYTTELYAYEIEIQAHFPDGITGYPARYAVPIGPC
ncbi:M12 family metallopeptidase [Longimicrobium sp.]|uniref:M12 family metallopeptidase n=1 Tax=Longimicrobium sp. TaxID=2029185 RepID=UPI002E30E3B4|nr:M12 family metallopeptidase [Longimicrobium sp.]HEX6040544.1 M12 family metallopeptidase [Longimicrobium sp.]